MSLFKGGLTARRYRVMGEVPADFRTAYQAQLEEFAFHEPTSALHEGESAGWTQIHNLLDTDFSDLNRWLYNHYLVGALRVDKKVLPAKLFAAHLDKRCQAWCRSNGKERCHAKKLFNHVKFVDTAEEVLIAGDKVQEYWEVYMETVECSILMTQTIRAFLKNP